MQTRALDQLCKCALKLKQLEQLGLLSEVLDVTALERLLFHFVEVSHPYSMHFELYFSFYPYRFMVQGVPGVSALAR